MNSPTNVVVYDKIWEFRIAAPFLVRAIDGVKDAMVVLASVTEVGLDNMENTEYKATLVKAKHGSNRHWQNPCKRFFISNQIPDGYAGTLWNNSIIGCTFGCMPMTFTTASLTEHVVTAMCPRTFLGYQAKKCKTWREVGNRCIHFNTCS